jgi:hypothetical protein
MISETQIPFVNCLNLCFCIEESSLMRSSKGNQARLTNASIGLEHQNPAGKVVTAWFWPGRAEQSVNLDLDGYAEFYITSGAEWFLTQILSLISCWDTVMPKIEYWIAPWPMANISQKAEVHCLHGPNGRRQPLRRTSESELDHLNWADEYKTTAVQLMDLSRLVSSRLVSSLPDEM